MATIDPYSRNFKTNGMYLRVLEMMGGNETLASNWWVTPNVNFGLLAPVDLMDTEDWVDVRAHLFGNKPNSGFDTNVGMREKFYNSNQQFASAPTGFTDDQISTNYYHDRKEREVEIYMRSLRTPLGSISRVYRANKGRNAGTSPSTTVYTGQSLAPSPPVLPDPPPYDATQEIVIGAPDPNYYG
jgi:hypothetical protein